MRVLVVGLPLPDPRIDNYLPLNAPAFFDYDAIVVDPASFTSNAAALIAGEREFEAQDGRPVINGATTASAVSAADQLRRRADETHRFLSSGGTVVVLARPNATQSGIVGFEGCDRFSWLPAPPGVAWAPPFIRAAEGKTVRITAEDHVFAPVLRDFRKSIAVRAILDDQHPAMAATGRVIARGGSNVAIAMEFPVLEGRVIFLPALIEETGSNRSKLASRIVDALTLITADPDAEAESQWERALAVPGLEQVEAEVEEAGQAASEASARLETAEVQSNTLRSYRRLLTREGPDFADAVAEALTLIGFGITAHEGPALTVEADGATIYAECEGSKERVVEWPYVRLQRRLEAKLLASGETPKGLVVVNGFRGKAPETREAQFTDPLRNASENYRYCLVTGETLFAVVQRALGGADDGFLAGVRRRLATTSGLLATEYALGEAEEQDAGPIF